MLVESGAAIFATTISDVETAADKCEEMEEGYTQCSQFLYGGYMQPGRGRLKNWNKFTPPRGEATLVGSVIETDVNVQSPPPLGVQEKLGVMNKGLVYALWDYTAQHPDELSFSEGNALAVLRRSDDVETEWWWARFNDREGYVPRNLLGVSKHKSYGSKYYRHCVMLFTWWYKYEIIKSIYKLHFNVTQQNKPMVFGNTAETSMMNWADSLLN